MSASDRLLVVDLAATSKNWAITPAGEERIAREAPPGWRIHFIHSATSSDGDGPPRPSDEVMAAVAGAEAYYGFGIPRVLFAEAKRLRWVHSAPTARESSPDAFWSNWCSRAPTGTPPRVASRP